MVKTFGVKKPCAVGCYDLIWYFNKASNSASCHPAHLEGAAPAPTLLRHTRAGAPPGKMPIKSAPRPENNWCHYWPLTISLLLLRTPLSTTPVMRTCIKLLRKPIHTFTSQPTFSKHICALRSLIHSTSMTKRTFLCLPPTYMLPYRKHKITRISIMKWL